jgi:hypothetical protein
MKIEEKIDVKRLVKKIKTLSTGTLLSALATLSPEQLVLINMALRTVAEQKLREEIRKEIRKQILDK